MFSKCKILFIALVTLAMNVYGQSGILPLPVGSPYINQQFYRAQFRLNLGVPLVADTTHGLNGLGDSLGLVIQIRSTGIWWKRDTCPGAHRWTQVGASSGSPGVWGSITGTLTDQGDLVAALAAKQNSLGFVPIAPGDTSTMLANYVLLNVAQSLFYPRSANPAGYISSNGLPNVSNFLQVINGGGVDIMLGGLYSARPSAGVPRRMYVATDSLKIYYDNGSVWLTIVGGGTGGSSTVPWGALTGTLSSQTDLQNALNLKVNIADTGAAFAPYIRRIGLLDSMTRTANGFTILGHNFYGQTANGSFAGLETALQFLELDSLYTKKLKSVIKLGHPGAGLQMGYSSAIGDSLYIPNFQVSSDFTFAAQTDSSRKLSANYSVLVGITNTQTLTNKTLTAPQINGGFFGTSSVANQVMTATGTNGAWSWQTPASGINGIAIYSSASVLNGLFLSGTTIGIGAADSNNIGGMAPITQYLKGSKHWVSASFFTNSVNFSGLGPGSVIDSVMTLDASNNAHYKAAEWIDMTGSTNGQVPVWNSSTGGFQLGQNGTGNPNTYVGSQFRPGFPGTNILKTFTYGYGSKIDSATANTLNWMSDTTLIMTTGTVQNVTASKYFRADQHFINGRYFEGSTYAGIALNPNIDVLVIDTTTNKEYRRAAEFVDMTGVSDTWVPTWSVAAGNFVMAAQGAGFADPGGNGWVVRTALNTSAARTLTGTTNDISITNPTGVGGNPVFDIGSNVVTLVGSQTLTNKTIGVSQLSGVIPGTNGGTNNGFMQFTGPATSTKTFTLPNANANILTDQNVVTVPQGGTGAATLSGYLFGNGTGAVTASASIPVSAITGAAPLASPTFTGTPSLPTGTTAVTQSANNNSTAVSTTAYADAIAALKANLSSPTFTGIPIAPTASTGTNTGQIASTQFVQTALQNVTASIFTPTISSTVNVTTSNPGFSTYMRINNIVSVWGYVIINNTTSSSQTTFSLNTPVLSTTPQPTGQLSSDNQASGSINGFVSAVPFTSSAVKFTYTATAGSSIAQYIFYNYSYTVN